ncbi:unnamed protein product [Darwinula stevensoni]|uniref:Uncharacterized protein n=1 Tax=Darwinula stevensoni TaxID=69355 RepID=A0A7R8X0T8_9CRUS|nr:unnamed protein product [Darwinula stevensoni]CAG0882053.1 unnamed protein product [Darwinula stevensoni]
MRILDASRRRRASTTASRCPSCKMILDDDGVRRLRCPFCGASWSVGNEAEDQLSLSQSRTSSLHLPLIDARPNLSLSGRFLGRFSPTHPNFTHIQGFTMRNGEERPASPEMSTLPPIALGGGSRRLVSMETSHRSLPSSASKLRQIRSARTPSKDTPPSEFQLIATPNKKIQRSTVDIEKEDFENMVQRARETGNYEEVGKVYTNVFQDFKSISATFKRASDQDSVTSLDSGLNMAFVNAVNDAMIGMPSNIHRIVLKSVFYGIMDESHRVCNQMSFSLGCKVHRDQTPSLAIIHRWVNVFKFVRKSFQDAAQSGRPEIANDKQTNKYWRKLIEDCRMAYASNQQIWGIGAHVVHIILREKLNVRNVCSSWVPNSLNKNRDHRVAVFHFMIMEFEDGQSRGTS